MKRLLLIFSLLFFFSCEDKENGEEMNPEPLKDKKYMDITRGKELEYNPYHLDKDIKSAVEWLKQELEGNYFRQFDFKAKKEVYGLINKAFEDVCKGTGKKDGK